MEKESLRGQLKDIRDVRGNTIGLSTAVEMPINRRRDRPGLRNAGASTFRLPLAKTWRYYVPQQQQQQQ